VSESATKSGVDGVVEDVKGKVKEVAGRVAGHDDLEAEGKAQQDKAANEREVAEHEAKAEVARGKAEVDEARERAAQEA
jgi:uncharacterized protein YjbJ (UPF0337 family)